MKKVKTLSFVNFVWKYCIMNVMKELKSYGFGEILSTSCFKKISSNQKFWYYKIIFSSTTPILSPRLSFWSAEDCENLYIFTVALLGVCWKTQCIVLKVQRFYLCRSKGNSVLLSTRDKGITIKFHESKTLNIGIQYHKDATYPWKS